MKKKHLNYLVLLAGLGFLGCSDGSTSLLPIEFDDQECEADEIICQKKAVYICEDGQWVMEEECLKGCDDNGFECAAGKSQTNDKNDKNDDGSCDDGKVECDNGVLKNCEGGEWSEKTCSNGCNDEGTACKSSEPAPVVEPGGDSKTCEDGTVICEADTLKTCSQNTWVTETCELGCDETANACKKPDAPECQTDEAKCTDEGSFSCEDGHWGFKTACENGCYETACATCKAGDSQCTDNHEKICQDNQWVEKDCDYYCNSEGTACAEVDQNQPTRYLMKTFHSPITPSVVERMKKIMAKNSSRNDNVFIEIGDSHYDYDNFMTCFSDQKTSMPITWGNHEDMKDVVAEFQKTKDSFARDSVAARGGRSTREMYNNTYEGACPSKDCIADEISVMNPRFAFFGHGSNDLGYGSFTFYLSDSYPGYQSALETYYRQLNKAIDELENAGVIPLISGISPCFMKLTYVNFLTYTNPPLINQQEHMRYAIPSFDAVSRGVAEARQLPWLDIYNILYPLPDHGLTTDYAHCRFKGAYENTCDFSSSGEQYGCNARNIYTVEMLNRAWRAVIKGENALDPIEEPYRGKGTQADPYLITSIPFTHEGNTTNGESKIDIYSACSDNAEHGPEVYYKLVLDERKYLRMFAVSATGVDVDLHVMKDVMDGNKCIVRTDILAHGYLEAGTYYIAVDTFGSDTQKPGQYLLGIVECNNRTNGTYSFEDKDVDEICRSRALFDVKNP